MNPKDRSAVPPLADDRQRRQKEFGQGRDNTAKNDLSSDDSAQEADVKGSQTDPRFRAQRDNTAGPTAEQTDDVDLDTAEGQNLRRSGT